MTVVKVIELIVAHQITRKKQPRMPWQKQLNNYEHQIYLSKNCKTKVQTTRSLNKEL